MQKGREDKVQRSCDGEMTAISVQTGTLMLCVCGVQLGISHDFQLSSHFYCLFLSHRSGIFCQGRHLLTKAKDAALASFDWQHVLTFTV